MRDSNSPSRKFSSCFNSKKTREEVDRRKIRSKISHLGLSHNLLLKFNTLPPRNNSNKRRKRPAHPRVRVSILQSTRFSFNSLPVLKTWIHRFYKKSSWSNNKFRIMDHTLKWESPPAKNKSDHKPLRQRTATESSLNSRRLLNWAISLKEASPALVSQKDVTQKKQKRQINLALFNTMRLKLPLFKLNNPKCLFSMKSI